MRSVKRSLAAGIAAGFAALVGTATTVEVTAVADVVVNHLAAASRRVVVSLLAAVSQAAVAMVAAAMDMAVSRPVAVNQAADAMVDVTEAADAKVATTKVPQRVRPAGIVTQAIRKNQAAFPLPWRKRKTSDAKDGSKNAVDC